MYNSQKKKVETNNTQYLIFKRKQGLFRHFFSSLVELQF